MEKLRFNLTHPLGVKVVCLCPLPINLKLSFWIRPKAQVINLKRAKKAQIRQLLLKLYPRPKWCYTQWLRLNWVTVAKGPQVQAWPMQEIHVTSTRLYKHFFISLLYTITYCINVAVNICPSVPRSPMDSFRIVRFVPWSIPWGTVWSRM